MQKPSISLRLKLLLGIPSCWCWVLWLIVVPAIADKDAGDTGSENLKHHSLTNSSIERQITNQPKGHILTNTGVWSSDSKWIVYDTRSDVAGEVFDGEAIEMVHVETSEVHVLYRSRHGAACGVASFHPRKQQVVFILGPERPTQDWQYSFTRRRGVLVDCDQPMAAANLDARDLVSPFTAGALRGGTHLHVFSGDGEWVSFTYEDLVLEMSEDPDAQQNQRNVGVAAPYGPVTVPKSHPRNHDGIAFSVLVTETSDFPAPGSDEIGRAYSDAWVGVNGYEKENGQHQRRAIAFIGDVVTHSGDVVPELFIVDIPENVTKAGTHRLEGSSTSKPSPPDGTAQRRLTFTTGRPTPGLGTVRHWPRSAPDGKRIGFLMCDDVGVVQFWTISPNGGLPKQETRNDFSIESAFSWRPDGHAIACIAGGSVCEIKLSSGETTRVTPVHANLNPLRSEACVYSPDGAYIAYVRTVQSEFNQIFIARSQIVETSLAP